MTDWKSMTPAQRLWARVECSAGCWLWTGTTTKGGYGQIKVGGKREYAHRLSFYLSNPDAPRAYELVVMHLLMRYARLRQPRAPEPWVAGGQRE